MDFESNSNNFINGNPTVFQQGVGISGVHSQALNQGNMIIKNKSNQSAVDQFGIVSNSNNFIQTNSAQAALNQTFTTTSYVLVTGSSSTFSLKRTTTIEIFLTGIMYLIESAGNTCDGTIELNVDGNHINSAILQMNSGNDFALTLTAHALMQLGFGSHTIKLRGKLNIYAGAPTMVLSSYRLSYVLLGT